MSGPLSHLACPRPAPEAPGSRPKHAASGQRRGLRLVEPLRPTQPSNPPGRRALRPGVMEQALPFDAPAPLLIAGSWRDAADGRMLPVEDPATGLVMCQVADAGEADAVAALDAAASAQAGWAATAPRERQAILRRAAAALEAERERVARCLTLETGKPLAEARAEVDTACEYLAWNADEALRIGGRCTESADGKSQLLVMRRPVGPVLAITPWNFPLVLAARALAPALAAGCALVLRPSALAPLSALWLARALERAGLPAGVLNVVVSSTDALTDPLLSDRRLRKLTFTGSARVGRMLLAQSAPRVLRTSMELGGHAPFLVFADADLGAAVEGALLAKCRNAGQVCTAASRLYVHRSLVEAFSERLAARMAGLRIGPGRDPGTEIGPLISAAQRERVQGLVSDALARGARLVTGGEPVPGPGFFYRPTVLADVPPEARLMHEEIFGPVAPVVAFDAEEEAIRLANRSDYGLAGYCYTRDLERVLGLATSLEVGMLGVNQPTVSCVRAPFGGSKQSGLGRAGGSAGIQEYLETHYLAIGRGGGGR
jgi:succinate-semialdehyde dehydrogenase / glutarate-semialdehyde dehydrogenase